MANATTAPVAAEASAEAKPRSKKTLLIAGVAALAIAGGGAAFFLRGDGAAKPAEPPSSRTPARP